MADASQDDFADAQQDRTTVLRQNFAAGIASVLDGNDDEAAARPSATAGFAAQLAEVAWMWTTTALAPDLEAFARHAKRKSIDPQDVLLAARKNEVTHALVEREADRLRSVRRKVGEGA